MRARHRATRERSRPSGGRVTPHKIVLTAAAVGTASAIAMVMNDLAGASVTQSETHSTATTNLGHSQAPAPASAGTPRPVLRPATTWYSDWSTSGSGSSSGTKCDPMALRWC
ncbi:hypothetical protein H4W33_004282 [Kibdelosporangium phytohabitans]|nr:hypothetical protein [Kibdelosporangium phytohabitans]